jgi:AraC-like DNA-binding protein/membrane-bound metal-dependent hydrolase YbcI (DUF457 family)
MLFQFFDAIILLGSINAFVFSGIIFLKKPSTIANQVSSGLLFVLGLLCVKILLHTLNLWQTPWFRYFPLGIDLFFQPILYLYVLALTEPQRVNQKLLQKHSILPIIYLIYAIIVYFTTVFVENNTQKIEIAGSFFYDEIKFVEDILSVVFGVYYGILSYRQLGKYQHWVETYISNTAVPTYQWLRNLLYLSALMLFLLGLMLVAQSFQRMSFVPIQLFYFYLVGLIYVFGFFGFRHQAFKISLDLISKKSEAASNVQLKELFEKFEQWLLSTKPYLEPDLNLNQCAEKLNCSPQNLSETIHSSSFKNFRDCVNHYRVEEFKQRIQKANLQKETIIGIAYDCGFNSEPSFYRIFKEKTGKAPKDFLSK